MNAKELKDILANVPDDTMVVVSNPRIELTDIIGHQYTHTENTLYLDIKNFK